MHPVISAEWLTTKVDRAYKKKYAYEFLFSHAFYSYRLSNHLSMECISVHHGFSSHQRLPIPFWPFINLSTPYNAEIPTPRTSKILCIYALNNSILDITLFWILCIRAIYNLQLYRCTVPPYKVRIQHAGIYYFFHKLPGKECIVWQWHFWYWHFFLLWASIWHG